MTEAVLVRIGDVDDAMCHMRQAGGYSAGPRHENRMTFLLS
jgi:hypothetical protein